MQNDFLLVSIWEIDVSLKRPNTAVISQLVLNSVLKILYIELQQV